MANNTENPTPQLEDREMGSQGTGLFLLNKEDVRYGSGPMVSILYLIILMYISHTYPTKRITFFQWHLRRLARDWQVKSDLSYLTQKWLCSGILFMCVLLVISFLFEQPRYILLMQLFQTSIWKWVDALWFRTNGLQCYLLFQRANQPAWLRYMHVDSFTTWWT